MTITSDNPEIIPSITYDKWWVTSITIQSPPDGVSNACIEFRRAKLLDDGTYALSPSSGARMLTLSDVSAITAGLLDFAASEAKASGVID